MAKKDAYCTRCGSLIQVDEAKEKSTCIFCKAEIDTAHALSLNTDSESRLLLQKAAEQKAKEEAAALREKNKAAKPSLADMAAARSKAPKQEIVLKPLPMKTKLAFFGSLLGIILLAAAIITPVILTRNARRADLTAELTKDLGIGASDLAYQHNDNSGFIFVTSDTYTEDAAAAAFETYVSAYSAVYGVTPEEARRKVAVTVYDASGRYVCSYADGKVRADFETASPTPTAAPTQTIGE